MPVNGLAKAQPLTIYRSNPPTEPESRTVGTIAVCTREDIKSATAMSWLMIDLSFLQPYESVGRFFIEGNVLTMQRNACLTEMEGDWILFIDSDMTFPPDSLRRLLETQEKTGADIVGGLCFQRGAPFQPTLYVQKEGAGFTFMELWDDGDVVDVDGTGMAFCLITVTALRKIIARQTETPLEDVEWPDRETRRRSPANFFQWKGDWGEDFGFCLLARDAGCRIVVDTGVEITHLATVPVTKETFWREVAFRPADAYQGKKDLGESVGIGTMTNAQALEKLGMKLEIVDDGVEVEPGAFEPATFAHNSLP